MGIKICGTGSYLPENIITNERFAEIVDTSDEWISTRTGIHCRSIADGDTNWSMGVHAAERALENAGVSAMEIDLIVLSTLSADYSTPSMSCVIQGVIGAQRAICMDINCACTGFPYALDLAWRYLSTGDDIKTALIIGSEMVSGIVDFTDRSTCVLFGDGAGACVVRAAPNALYASALGADGRGSHLIYCKNKPHTTPFTTKPPVENEISRQSGTPGYFMQEGKEVYKFATKMMPMAIEQACAKAGLTPAELDWIVPHQANVRILQTAMKNIGLPMDKLWLNIDHTGNTSSATIPIALDELAHSGRLLRGQKICVVGFGAGLTYGAVVFDW